ncbi:shTK domain protein [Necator americanus]|uniref:ShTK domain protein n=1 Tax=Necator americanus TaxID=51031 RepID=W2SHS1_NECAM|nr:shTK domain protein [Necator americanus]ETN69204.1 shTK domain protein [Necator americanus]
MFIYSSILLYSALYISQITAQTCAAGADNGPCLNGVCFAGTTCLTALDICCSDTGIIPDTTLASTVASTLASDSSVASTVTSITSASLASSATTTTSATCVDKLNPRTGVSDCSMRASLCNDPTYLTVMTEQCPRTCGRCSSSSGTITTTTSTTCVDKVNPRTGTSDCPMRSSLCLDSNYIALMRTECPRTCGFCTSTGSTVSGTATVATVTSATATTRAAGTCVDAINPRTGVSDCPQRVSLCNDSVYRDLMQSQCPLTCGLC